VRSFTSRVRSDAVGVSIDPRKNAQLPPLKYSDFAGGFFRGAKDIAVPKNAAADALDIEITRDDKLRRAPGTTRVESYGSRVPRQLILHPSLDFTSELLTISTTSDLGVKREGATAWYGTNLPIVGPKFFYAMYGDTLLLSNGRHKIFSREPRATVLTELSDLPLGRTMAVIAGRLFIGGAALSGNFEPMGQFWSGADGFDDVDPLNGAGGELLIADTGYGDAIIANRIIGLDMMAILCRRSIWIGRITGLPERPLDFQIRMPGKGCVTETCARTVHGGVMYLGDEGVELFDGNDAVHKSLAIDAEILPLDMEQIDLYSAAYDPRRRWYYLFTPSATYIYDLRFSRWYKRGMVALSGTIFAEQFPAITWGEAVGTWGEQLLTWADMSPEESGIADMLFVGLVPGEAYVVEKEDYESTTYFGAEQDPFWTTLEDDLGQQNNRAFTAKVVRVQSEGEGLVEVLLLNGTSLGTMQVVDDDDGVFQMKCNQTSRATGLTIRPFSGQPIISEIEVDIVPRSQLRKTDVRQQTLATFGFVAGEPVMNVDSGDVPGQLGLNDTVQDDINVDDAVPGPAVPVLDEDDASVTVILEDA
jgi:hypothetical protein